MNRKPKLRSAASSGRSCPCGLCLTALRFSRARSFLSTRWSFSLCLSLLPCCRSIRRFGAATQIQPGRPLRPDEGAGRDVPVCKGHAARRKAVSDRRVLSYKTHFRFCKPLLTNLPKSTIIDERKSGTAGMRQTPKTADAGTKQEGAAKCIRFWLLRTIRTRGG